MKRAHAHLISVVAAELSEIRAAGETIRLLDIGCGYGGLIRDLVRELPRFGVPANCIQIYGYEIVEQRARFPGYLELLMESLSRLDPNTDWSERIRVGSAKESWPFEDGMFHGAFSNQVVEHVENLDKFFRELKRVSAPGGFAAHYYPSKEVFIEPHSGVPFAHWMRRSVLNRWIRFCSVAGLGKYRRYRKERASCLNGFCGEFCSYLGKFVYFRRNGEIKSLARSCSAKAGFKYGFPLVWRATFDDWDATPYQYTSRYKEYSALSPFSSSTLVQRF